jgi:hypothetical protein
MLKRKLLVIGYLLFEEDDKCIFVLIIDLVYTTCRKIFHCKSVIPATAGIQKYSANKLGCLRHLHEGRLFADMTEKSPRIII